MHLVEKEVAPNPDEVQALCEKLSEDGTMKQGSVRAMGIQFQGSWDWRFILAGVMFLQLIVFILLNAVLGPLPIPTSLIPYALLVTVSIFIASLPVLAYLRRGAEVGVYEVSWKDDREVSGRLEISYSTPKRRRRSGLIVAQVKARPNEPLYMGGTSRYQPARPVPGTEASLVISFKNERRISLGLGFGDVDEMNSIYDQLK